MPRTSTSTVAVSSTWSLQRRVRARRLYSAGVELLQARCSRRLADVSRSPSASRAGQLWGCQAPGFQVHPRRARARPGQQVLSRELCGPRTSVACGPSSSVAAKPRSSSTRVSSVPQRTTATTSRCWSTPALKSSKRRRPSGASRRLIAAIGRRREVRPRRRSRSRARRRRRAPRGPPRASARPPPKARISSSTNRRSVGRSRSDTAASDRAAGATAAVVSSAARTVLHRSRLSRPPCGPAPTRCAAASPACWERVWDDYNAFSGSLARQARSAAHPHVRAVGARTTTCSESTAWMRRALVGGLG